MEFGDTSGLWTDYAADIAQIKRTIKDIESGVIRLVPDETGGPGVPVTMELDPPVSKYDNHVLFIQKLNEYRKSEKYEMLDVDKKEVLQSVMDAHTEWIARMTNPGVAVPPQPPINLGNEIAEEQSNLEADATPVEQNLQNSQNRMRENAEAM